MIAVPVYPFLSLFLYLESNKTQFQSYKLPSKCIMIIIFLLITLLFQESSQDRKCLQKKSCPIWNHDKAQEEICGCDLMANALAASTPSLFASKAAIYWIVISHARLGYFKTMSKTFYVDVHKGKLHLVTKSEYNDWIHQKLPIIKPASLLLSFNMTDFEMPICILWLLLLPILMEALNGTLEMKVYNNKYRY